MHALGSWCERYRSGTGARQSDRSSLWIKTRSALQLYFARSAPRSLHAPLRSHALSGVKFFRIPAGSHPFKKIDDICDCKLLNGQTGTILRSKRLVLVALTSYQETLKSSFIIPFCFLKLESLDCMNSFLYVKLCKLIVL